LIPIKAHTLRRRTIEAVLRTAEAAMSSLGTDAATVDSRWPFHEEADGVVAAEARALFDHLDDPERLSAHMARRSWRMGGGRMDLTLDAAGGRDVGARMRLAGRAFGLALSLDEVVVERHPAATKAWETIGEPHLGVIGPYRMGFAITPTPTGANLRAFLDYALPSRWPDRWLGRLLAPAYARWCVRSMVADAVAHFALSARR
jgi:hypothetical protein